MSVHFILFFTFSKLSSNGNFEHAVHEVAYCSLITQPVCFFKSNDANNFVEKFRADKQSLAFLFCSLHFAEAGMMKFM